MTRLIDVTIKERLSEKGSLFLYGRFGIDLKNGALLNRS